MVKANPRGMQLGSLFPEEILPPPSLQSLFPELAGCSRHTATDAHARPGGSLSGQRVGAKAKAKTDAKEAKAMARSLQSLFPEVAVNDAQAVQGSVSSGHRVGTKTKAKADAKDAKALAREAGRCAAETARLDA